MPWFVCQLSRPLEWLVFFVSSNLIAAKLSFAPGRFNLQKKYSEQRLEGLLNLLSWLAAAKTYIKCHGNHCALVVHDRLLLASIPPLLILSRLEIFVSFGAKEKLQGRNDEPSHNFLYIRKLEMALPELRAHGFFIAGGSLYVAPGNRKARL